MRTRIFETNMMCMCRCMCSHNFGVRTAASYDCLRTGENPPC